MEVSEEEDRAEAARHAFRELRPLCTQLLELVARKPDDCASVLESLAQVLRNEPSIGLQACME
jgi:ethanolamine utilization cobalamin adenosyltransferase